MTRGTVLAGLAAAVVALPLLGATSSQATDQSTTSVSYPAYHRVQRGETLWSIARDFLAKAQDKRVTKVMTKHEVQQIEILNKDKVKDPDKIYAGERLLLAPAWWDVPDGVEGWGGGFSGCTDPPIPHRGRAPFDDVTARVRPVDAPIDERRERVLLVMRNTGDRTRSFYLWTPRAQLRDPHAARRSAVFWTDVGTGPTLIELAPGDRRTVHTTEVRSFRCGDTPTLKHRFQGQYDLYGVLPWSKDGRHSHLWRTPANEVRVTR